MCLQGSQDDSERSIMFHSYLRAVYAFTQHPSQMFSAAMQPVWIAFLSHEDISRNADLRSFVPRVLESTRNSLRKVAL